MLIRMPAPKRFRRTKRSQRTSTWKWASLRAHSLRTAQANADFILGEFINSKQIPSSLSSARCKIHKDSPCPLCTLSPCILAEAGQAHRDARLRGPQMSPVLKPGGSVENRGWGRKKRKDSTIRRGEKMGKGGEN